MARIPTHQSRAMAFRYRLTVALLSVVVLSSTVAAQTQPPLEKSRAPQNFDEMWEGFDPRAEPLDVEVLKEWEDDDVVLRVVRFRIGVFKGTKARLAAIYGFPKSESARSRRIPGLLQIHGGGQYADHRACLTNARRGYATLSIAWAGRISAPGYRVSPAEVQLFWDAKTEDPGYRLTTDWGALDGYHAPGRNAGNQFPSVKAAAWTLDDVESPRNSGWFLCAVAARRALTFLERQPEVDPQRLGVYGHSMGGKLTVMTASDPRVKAAAPSCGGISDRDNISPLFRRTLGDDVHLQQISCPIMFLSPANDFHGRIGDLPEAVREINSREWRVTCSPHHNHQDTPPFEVATQVWFDAYLKSAYVVPRTPITELKLNSAEGVPVIVVEPDVSRAILGVDVYYTQHGKTEEGASLEQVKHRFWHYAATTKSNGVWTAPLPLTSTDLPLWVYANVRYALDDPVTGAGYYYRVYTADSFNLSSQLTMVSADMLREARIQATVKPTRMIENFTGNWQKEWFTYRPAEWEQMTNKLSDQTWAPPVDAELTLGVRTAESNTLVVVLDKHACAVKVRGDNSWQQITLHPRDFIDVAGKPLTTWEGVRLLKLTHRETLRPPRGSALKPRHFGQAWQGTPPKFRNLRWTSSAD